jgi:hypothetical protein
MTYGEATSVGLMASALNQHIRPMVLEERPTRRNPGAQCAPPLVSVGLGMRVPPSPFWMQEEESKLNQSQTDYQTLQEQRSIRRRLVLLGTGALIYLFVVMAVALWRGSNSHAGPTATAPVAVNR